MIKYIKKLWNKLFGKKEVVVETTSAPKSEHCNDHKRFRKSCPACLEIIR
jgi:hypothetical protein|tara:strand:+ start:325 stop:474 length:150 start_codon:yes stop_codon:yes gene_type:complete